MPVLNVPFRLIFARNINREGILDNNYQPEKKWRFRFAVGSTFYVDGDPATVPDTRASGKLKR